MSAIPVVQKLLLLYVLEGSRCTLTMDQVERYFLENGWSDYFSVRQMVQEMIEAGLLFTTGDFPQYLKLTRQGRDTLVLFRDRFPLHLHRAADDFLQRDKERIERESRYFSQIIPAGDDRYKVLFHAFDEGEEILHIEIKVDGQDHAEQLAEDLRLAGDSIRETLLKTGREAGR